MTGVIWLKGCTVLILPCQMWTHCSLDEHSYLTPHYSPMKTGRQSNYYPDFGLSRQVMFSHSVRAPQEDHVSFKHRLISICDSHASHLLVYQFVSSARDQVFDSFSIGLVTLVLLHIRYSP